MGDVKIVKFDCHGHNAPAYGCNLPGYNSGSYVLHTDYAALEARLNALVEAVKKMRAADSPTRWDALEYLEACAEVDRLLENQPTRGGFSSTKKPR